MGDCRVRLRLMIQVETTESDGRLPSEIETADSSGDNQVRVRDCRVRLRLPLQVETAESEWETAESD